MTETGLTLTELRKRASELDIAGRSTMDEEELVAAIAQAENATPGGDTAAHADDTDDGPDPVANDVNDLPPSTPDEVGRPPLVEVAQERAAARNPRKIGRRAGEES